MKTSIFISTLALLFGTVSLTKAQQNEELKKFLAEEQYTKAVEQLSKLPDYEQKKHDMAVVYLAAGQTEKATTVVNELLTTDPKDAVATALSGSIELMHNKKAEAIALFDKAVKLDKKNTQVYELICKSCLSQNTDTATINKYLKAGLKINGKASSLHAIEGDVLMKLNDYGTAANAYQRAIFYNPADAQSQRKIGLVYTAALAYQQALEALQKCKSMDPTGILVNRNLGDLYYIFGKYAEAETAYKTYLDATTPSQQDIERFAFTLFYEKKYQESSDLIEKLMSKTDRPAVLYRLKGYMAYELNNDTDAKAYMDKFFAIRTSEENILPSDYGYYARILSRQNNDSLAIISFEKAIAADTTSTEYLADLAKVYSTSKQHQNAIRLYRKMITKGSDKATMTFNIGKEYYFEGDEIATIINQQQQITGSTFDFAANTAKRDSSYAQAASAFAQVQKFSPNYAGGYIWCGRMKALLDPEATKDEARTNYEQALTVLEKGDAQKNKKMIVECLKYLGSYYYLASERADKTAANELKQRSVDYFSKVLTFVPDDSQAIEVMDKLKVN